MYPQVGEAIVKLLNRYNISVAFPEKQTCCGQPTFNSGYWKEAKATAVTLLEAFEDSDFVIAPSGSCVSMLHHYPKLFEHEPVLLEKAIKLKEKTYEFTQFLINVLQISNVGASFPYKVTYHPSCHGTRILGVKEEPLKLLETVKGLVLIPLPFSNFYTKE